MRKISTYLTISFLMLSFAASVLAADNDFLSTGLTPDSPFYFFKTLKENIRTFLTFGEENKAKQFLRLADIRMAEYQKLLDKGKTDLAQKTLDKYEKQLNRAVQKIEELKNKGKDVKDISEELSNAAIKHIDVLEKNLQKVPEAAKKGIKRALENAQKIKPVGSELFCETVDDCACGRNKNTGECFYGNKEYVDEAGQCPDFCAGITGKLKISCVDGQCRQVNPPKDETANQEIKVNGDITAFVKNFLEPAPDGYKWEYSLDWDKTVISKCLINAVKKDGPIDDATYFKIRKNGRPQGYWWTTEQKMPITAGPNINIKFCLYRLECQYGKIEKSQKCIVPR